MQTLTSQYEREPLTVGSEIPTAALRHVLGWVHVSTPDSEVEHMVRERCLAHDYTPEQTEQTIAAALWLQEENRCEYRWVMGGHPA